MHFLKICSSNLNGSSRGVHGLAMVYLTQLCMAVARPWPGHGLWPDYGLANRSDCLSWQIEVRVLVPANGSDRFGPVWALLTSRGELKEPWEARGQARHRMAIMSQDQYA